MQIKDVTGTNQLKDPLEEIDLDIDRGLGNEELVNSRLAILHQIQKIDNLESKERAQKAKIKMGWLEGDENSGFFHGLDFPNQSFSEQVNRCQYGEEDGPRVLASLWIGKVCGLQVRFKIHYVQKANPGALKFDNGKSLVRRPKLDVLDALEEKGINLAFVHEEGYLGMAILSTLFWDDVCGVIGGQA
ncbi:hypothetical protein Tco_0973021 [Tanacetum coccineum]